MKIGIISCPLGSFFFSTKKKFSLPSFHFFLLLLLLILFLIRGYLLDNVMLFFAIYQHYSCPLLEPRSHLFSIPSLQAVTERWFLFPASYCKLPLAGCITYGNTYASVLVSLKSSRPFLLPLMPKVYALCLSPMLPYMISGTIFLDFIYMG